jgi:HEAT repeat protein
VAVAVFSAAVALPVARRIARSSPDELVRCLGDPDARARARAAESLAALGSPSIRVLVDALGDPDWFLRREAALALGASGTAASEAVAPLVARLSPAIEPCDPVRAVCAHALGLLGRRTGRPVPADGGVVGESTVRALADATRDASRIVRYCAAEAIGRVGDTASGRALPALALLLDDPDVNIQRIAAEAMYGFAEGAAPAIAPLLARAATGDRQVRRWALLALGRVGHAAARAVPVAAQVLRERDRSLMPAAVELLRAVGPAAGPAALELAALLEHGPRRIVLPAIDALGAIGPPAAAALPALEAARATPDRRIGERAAAAIHRIRAR